MRLRCFACLLVLNHRLSLLEILPDCDIQVEKSNRSDIFETFQVSSSLLFPVIIALACGGVVVAGLITAQTRA